MLSCRIKKCIVCAKLLWKVKQSKKREMLDDVTGPQQPHFL